MTIGPTNKEQLLMEIREALKGCHEAAVPYRHLSRRRGDRPE
jgi:hypothetical protein